MEGLGSYSNVRSSVSNFRYLVMEDVSVGTAMTWNRGMGISGELR